MGNIFLDSANLDEIELFLSSSLVSGVTTNPALVGKAASGDYYAHLKKVRDKIQLCQKEKSHLSVEMIQLDDLEAFQEELLWFRNNFFEPFSRTNVDISLKIPIHIGHMHKISQIDRVHMIPVNATAASKATQAALAWNSGATYVSFFYARSVDARHALGVRDELINARTFCPERGKIICGSIRTPEHVVECFLAGADIVTAPAKVLEDCLESKVTSDAIKQFDEAVKGLTKCLK